ncbi:MAG TPA: sulfate adenylyltransferase [Candidatus Marinimicrobia bacterium]|nr:sulfate adenylyltransferase [Candidatus Neomarinimicrobiota bacterium]HIA86235.1 sulfate adenylyltransferase [Candidatus Neomarinimicrobiota bacterium]HIB58506.1 sulfate adenylyltransferase [Candidatus Neomarinimicrobiota bacterium]
MINPHGGPLVDRMVPHPEELDATLTTITLSRRSQSDLEMIATGACSPLTGFMSQQDYSSVVEEMRLANGSVWSIPITLPISAEQVSNLKGVEEATLSTESDGVIGKIQISDIYKPDKGREAEKVYLATDDKHPGVAALLSGGKYYVAGDIEVYQLPEHKHFGEYRMSPRQLRAVIEEKGWKSVVAFQTRNPIHRAHEYITKCALEMVDGLIIHPIVGETKSDDIPADVRMACYEAIIEHYYPHRHTILSVYPASMRYAGPREAIFHALTRKNYGCTHFIVGRDHAGVGSYYGTYDAQKIFENFNREELGIEPMFFEHAFYCKRTNSMATTKTSRAMDHEKVFLSGTKVREMLIAGVDLPEEFTRPEVSDILKKHYGGSN